MTRHTRRRANFQPTPSPASTSRATSETRRQLYKLGTGRRRVHPCLVIKIAGADGVDDQVDHGDSDAARPSPPGIDGGGRDTGRSRTRFDRHRETTRHSGFSRRDPGVKVNLVRRSIGLGRVFVKVGRAVRGRWRLRRRRPRCTFLSGLSHLPTRKVLDVGGAS